MDHEGRLGEEAWAERKSKCMIARMRGRVLYESWNRREEGL